MCSSKTEKIKRYGRNFQDKTKKKYIKNTKVLLEILFIKYFFKEYANLTRSSFSNIFLIY